VKAIQAFERALSLNPDAPHISYNLGLICKDRDELERALVHFQNALRANPAVWAKTLLVVTYDEHGGFYDHVIPHAADARGVNPDPSVSITEPVDVGVPGTGGDKTKPRASPAEIVPYGVRVPTFLVSPWVAKGKVVSEVFDHCSILKTVLARFTGDARPFMSDRVEASRSFNEVLTETAPRMSVPNFAFPMPAPVPDPARKRTTPSRTTKIVTPPISRRQMDEGNVDYHSLTGWWARQLGR
jgi:tetratricopeptide (TPR) repeat protein